MFEQFGRNKALQGEISDPLSIKGELTEPLSRWLWIVKRFLLIPHDIALIFLWIAFAIVWIIALFAILFTGRYPRRLFYFNVGVIRWTWRVEFYGHFAFATDKYPPFNMKAGGYPADFDVTYPDNLSRGLVLIKWWLLAVPQYLVVIIFADLILLLTLYAGIAILFKRQYPKNIFSFVMGMNHWYHRVLAYVSLMTDHYPPFRLGE